MRQVLQELDSGKTLLAEVPEPGAAAGTLRLVTRRSLISAGTERMLVEFARAGWMERARQQPERVRQALDKARTDGLAATVAAVRSRLAQALPHYENEKKRKDPIRWAGPVLGGGQLIVLSSSGVAMWISPLTGETTYQTELSDKGYLGPVIADNTLYLLTDDAKLSAYR